MEPIVVKEGNAVTGILFGVLQYGGEIGIGDGWAVRIVKLNEKFSKIQLIHHGAGVKPVTSSWKAPKKKPTTEKFTVEEKVEEESAW